MGSRRNNVSLHGIAAERNATTRSAPDEELASRGDLTSLRAALEHDAITALAHRYWQERGCPEGSAAEDWFRAEQDFHNRIEFGEFPDYFEVGVVLRLPH
jgi:hypothetical protein